MRVSLRAWSHQDLPVLTRIRSDAALQAQLMARPRPGDVREWLQRRTADPTGAFFVIDCDGACAGFVQLTEIVRGESGYVGICVAPEAQGRGLGAKALALIEAHAAATHGVQQVKLKVLETNVRALSLYQRLGYQRVPADSEGSVLLAKASNVFAGTVR